MTFAICYKIFDQEFLLKFRPMVGFGRYDKWIQTKNNSGIYSITTTHDQCLGAYSRSSKSIFTSMCSNIAF